MPHVLITGGSGFIGSHVVAHFLRNNDWLITVLDGLSYVADISRLTDDYAFDPARVKVHWWDLRSAVPDRVREHIGSVDYVVNLASESHVDKSIADARTFVLNNVQLVINMLEAFIPRKAFIQISTDEVFGPAPDGYAFREDDTHCPSNPYSASKSCQEQIATSYWRTYGLPIIIVRTMNNFGERQDKEKLVPKAIHNLLDEKPVPVHGENLMGHWHAGSRVWLHARNFADGLLFILKNLPPHRYPEAPKPDCYHITSNVEMSNLEIVEKIAGILGVPVRIEWQDVHKARPGHDRRYALDGSKLFALGWKPPIDIDESFRRTVLWEKGRLDAK